MHVIENHKIAPFDVDDSIVLWNSSEYEGAHDIEVSHKGYISFLHVHKEHINLMVKLIKLGYDIVVWSRSGYSWAEAVVEALVDCGHLDKEMLKRITIMSKPTLFVDDQTPDVWLGEHVYREPTKALKKETV